MLGALINGNYFGLKHGLEMFETLFITVLLNKKFELSFYKPLIIFLWKKK